jgi:drug/metabolite transporter (DMT)-like permease
MIDVENNHGEEGIISSNASDSKVNCNDDNASESGLSKITQSIHSYNSISQQDSDTTDSVGNEQEAASYGLRQLWIWGGLCGISNFIGSALQQTSLISISVAKCGFITGMYVVIVPLFEWFIPGHRDSINKISIFAALFSMVGMYLLSGCTQMSEEESCWSSGEGKGELLVFISVFCWVGSIIGSDIGLERKVCPVSITCVDFVICTVLNIILAIYLEPEQWVYPYTAMRENIWWMVLVGVTEAIAFLLSTYGQKEIDATRASLLMSLEAVSSSAGGYLFLNETLSLIEVLGCVIMFAATLLPSLVDYLEEGGEEKDNSETSNNNINSTSKETEPLLGHERRIVYGSESIKSKGLDSSANARDRFNSKDLELTSKTILTNSKDEL